MTLVPYPEYKDSGLPWLGKIPTHWEVRRVKSLSMVKRGASPRPIEDPKYFDKNGEYAWVRISDVTGSERYLKSTTQRLSKLGHSLSVPIEPGMLFLSIAGSVGKPIISKIKCCIHDGFVYFPYFKGNSEFLYYTFKSGGLYKGLGKFGTQLNLNTSIVGNIRIALPPDKEQQTIVSYLDYQTRKINRFIRNKRRLIQLLEEQKQAVINRAVTRGLDPHVKLKPSGIQWLGDIPEHWQVRKLRYLGTKFGSGITPRGGATVYKKSGIPFLRSQNIYFDGLRIENVAFIAPEVHNNMKNSQVKPRDVLLNITGASIGRACLIPSSFGEGNVNQHVCIIRLKPDLIISEYLVAFISTPYIQRQIYAVQNGASREGLPLNSIKAMAIAVPPLNEQNEIISMIGTIRNDINAAIARAQREIQLMGEYRTRLIADVVTGKIDVRSIPIEAVPEPEDPEDNQELPDDTDDLLNELSEMEEQ